MVAVIVLAFLAGLGSSTVLLSSSGSGTASSSTASTQCATAAAGGVRLQVLNNTSGKPIASASVSGEVDFPDCSHYYTSATLDTAATNATGFVSFGSEIGTYYLTVQVPRSTNYFVDVTARPEQTTCVTLYVPSGEFTVRYSQTFQFTC
jgi:hypothetical protein